MTLLCRPVLPGLSLSTKHRPSVESFLSFRTCLPLFRYQRALELNCCASHSNARNLAYANHQKHKRAPFTFILACYLTSWGGTKNTAITSLNRKAVVLDYLLKRDRLNGVVAGLQKGSQQGRIESLTCPIKS